MQLAIRERPCGAACRRQSSRNESAPPWTRGQSDTFCCAVCKHWLLPAFAFALWRAWAAAVSQANAHTVTQPACRCRQAREPAISELPSLVCREVLLRLRWSALSCSRELSLHRGVELSAAEGPQQEQSNCSCCVGSRGSSSPVRTCKLLCRYLHFARSPLKHVWPIAPSPLCRMAVDQASIPRSCSASGGEISSLMSPRLKGLRQCFRAQLIVTGQLCVHCCQHTHSQR